MFLRTDNFRSTSSPKREIEQVITQEGSGNFRSSLPEVQLFAKNFYVVTFKKGQGYAFVSKDKRTFPIYAGLDGGQYQLENMESKEMLHQVDVMNRHFRKDIEQHKKNWRKITQSQLRSKGSSSEPKYNSENAREDFMSDGWKITREIAPRTYSAWDQDVETPSLFLNEKGAPYNEVYQETSGKLRKKKEKDDVNYFGCTTVAFGQILYALRYCRGVKDLTYTSGEKVLWNRMTPWHSLDSKENLRFLGWITANCDPGYHEEGTIIFNRDAKAFVEKKLGSYLSLRYDNCVPYAGDFDGYGWAEDRVIAEEMFGNSNCFVAMTASSGTFDYFSYHSFVIDGVIDKDLTTGWGWFKRKKKGIRHLYHVNAGWSGYSNGYYLYVQNVGDDFEYTGANKDMDYRSNVGYTVIKPK